MKKTILSLASLCLVSLSAVAVERVTITGNPVVFERQGEFYVVPETYTYTNYIYTTIDGTNRVCYLEKQANLSGISDVRSVGFTVKGEKKAWNCYTVDPVYYQIVP